MPFSAKETTKPAAGALLRQPKQAGGQGRAGTAAARGPLSLQQVLEVVYSRSEVPAGRRGQPAACSLRTSPRRDRDTATFWGNGTLLKQTPGDRGRPAPGERIPPKASASPAPAKPHRRSEERPAPPRPAGSLPARRDSISGPRSPQAGGQRACAGGERPPMEEQRVRGGPMGHAP